MIDEVEKTLSGGRSPLPAFESQEHTRCPIGHIFKDKGRSYWEEGGFFSLKISYMDIEDKIYEETCKIVIPHEDHLGNWRFSGFIHEIVDYRVNGTDQTVS